MEAAAELPQPGPSPQDEVQRKERVGLVREAVKRLPERQRRCVVYYVEGHKYREIAELMELSPETVKAHLNQAKRRLRDRLV